MIAIKKLQLKVHLLLFSRIANRLPQRLQDTSTRKHIYIGKNSASLI